MFLKTGHPPHLEALLKRMTPKSVGVYFLDEEKFRSPVGFFSPFGSITRRCKLEGFLRGFTAVSSVLNSKWPVHRPRWVRVGVMGWAYLLWRNLQIWLCASGVQSYFYLCHHQGVLLDSPLILSQGSFSSGWPFLGGA